MQCRHLKNVQKHDEVLVTFGSSPLPIMPRDKEKYFNHEIFPCRELMLLESDITYSLSFPEFSLMVLVSCQSFFSLLSCLDNNTIAGRRRRGTVMLA